MLFGFRPLDIEFEDEEEDEDKIIEQRRKQREELLKVNLSLDNTILIIPLPIVYFFRN